MKVLQVSNYFPGLHRHVGGAEQACFRTARLAAAHGLSVSLVTTRPEHRLPLEFPAAAVPILEDYLPPSLRRFLEAAKWYTLQYDPLACRSFRKILARDCPEVVHFHNCQFLTLSLVAEARRAGCRTVMSIYDYWLFCPTVMLADPQQQFCRKAHGSWCLGCLPPRWGWAQRLLLAWRRPVIDHYLSRVDAFHVLSEHSQGVLEGYGIPPPAIHVAPLTLPLEFDDEEGPEPPEEPRTILFAGWLNKRKGLHRLLEALPLVLERYPDARLLAIGGPVRFGEEYLKKLNRLLDAGQIRDRVEFLGHVSPREMKNFIKRAGVVVIPEQYDNMSPLLMIEAMYLARPVVVSRVGGVPEFIRDGQSGWLADPLDARDLAEKIIRVFADPAQARAMGWAARETILAKCQDKVIWEKTQAMYRSREVTA